MPWVAECTQTNMHISKGQRYMVSIIEGAPALTKVYVPDQQRWIIITKEQARKHFNKPIWKE